MAVTAIYLLSLCRMIERLRDPFRLTEIEQRSLEGFLSGLKPTERLEIAKRTFAYEADRLAEKPEGKTYYPPRAVEAVFDKVDFVKKDLDWALERKDNGALADSMITGALWPLSKLTDDERRFVEFRGEISIHNQPWIVESWENVEWPNRPNSKRQAHIDVLQAKYDRLHAELLGNG